MIQLLLNYAACQFYSKVVTFLKPYLKILPILNLLYYFSGVIPSGPKMVKITYGGGLSGQVFPNYDDSGDLADESQVVEEEETR